MDPRFSGSIPPKSNTMIFIMIIFYVSGLDSPKTKCLQIKKSRILESGWIRLTAVCSRKSERRELQELFGLRTRTVYFGVLSSYLYSVSINSRGYTDLTRESSHFIVKDIQEDYYVDENFIQCFSYFNQFINSLEFSFQAVLC